MESKTPTVYFAEFDNFPPKKKDELVSFLHNIFNEHYGIEIDGDTFYGQYIFWIEDEKKEIVSAAALDFEIGADDLLKEYESFLGQTEEKYDLKLVEQASIINCVGTSIDCRRRGYSFTILNFMLDFIVSSVKANRDTTGTKEVKVFLECTGENEASCSLYKKLNFEFVATRMSKKLEYVLMVKSFDKNIL